MKAKLLFDINVEEIANYGKLKFIIQAGNNTAVTLKR